MDDMQKRVDQTAEVFRAAAWAHGAVITADLRVSEVEAAELVGYATGSFKNLRSLGAGPPFFNRPLAGSRISYRLDDLARWIEQSREETY